MHARYVIIFAAVAGLAQTAAAQGRVGSDSSTRIERLERDLGYGTLEGFGYAAIDQWRLSPPEWGTGWPGYGRRLASDVGEFWVQEITTEGLAAAMNRPLDYSRCRCRAFDARLGHALRGAVFDQLPRGRESLAIPRIVGAFAGAYAQATWRPSQSTSRTNLTLTNGTTSLALGALINIYHEFRR
ncbi:MAG TPA: hypothetical protein VGQ56_11915 [Gemmatimonadaceae bacterium]|jgi:hypothetical protein|nr:hypothetical protein [Gemmatimonadaceae bacterium]